MFGIDEQRVVYSVVYREEAVFSNPTVSYYLVAGTGS
jgi:hypothetical protein